MFRIPSVFMVEISPFIFLMELFRVSINSLYEIFFAGILH